MSVLERSEDSQVSAQIFFIHYHQSQLFWSKYLISSKINAKLEKRFYFENICKIFFFIYLY